MTRWIPMLLLLALPAAAQQAEFLNERLRIPESSRFDEGAYIESGVGLSFGVDKRLAYFPGQYEEAAQRFEEAVRRFKYKAEIWVFLARAYFYMRSPDGARDALQRADATMPDLSERLWQPLIDGLESEIRRRAARQQAQIDFYSTAPQDVFTLFRLYLFLRDHEASQALIEVAHQRAHGMRQKARMVSGSSRRAQLEEAGRWDDLGLQLADELRLEGIDVPQHVVDETESDDESTAGIDEAERLRILQLRVDYYKATTDDFEQLFQAYLDRDEPERARSVLASLRRVLFDVEVRASVAPTVDEQVAIEETLDELTQLAGDFEQRLPPAETPAAP
jgi:tetratricopeptide (TPR) repeat protein